MANDGIMMHKRSSSRSFWPLSPEYGFHRFPLTLKCILKLRFLESKLLTKPLLANIYYHNISFFHNEAIFGPSTEILFNFSGLQYQNLLLDFLSKNYISNLLLMHISGKWKSSIYTHIDDKWS